MPCSSGVQSKSTGSYNGKVAILRSFEYGKLWNTVFSKLREIESTDLL